MNNSTLFEAYCKYCELANTAADKGQSMSAATYYRKALDYSDKLLESEIDDNLRQQLIIRSKEIVNAILAFESDDAGVSIKTQKDKSPKRKGSWFSTEVPKYKLSDVKGLKDVIEQNNAFPVFKDTICASANILHNDGIVNGKANGEFCPDDCISLEEAIAILGRIIKKYNISVSVAELSTEYIETASPWVREHIPQTLLLCENALETTVPNYKNSVIVENAISMVMQLLYNI